MGCGLCFKGKYGCLRIQICRSWPYFFKYISDRFETKYPEIGLVIDEAMRSIEKENKRLKDIIPKNFVWQELDKRRLGEVVDLFTNIQMPLHEWGKTFKILAGYHQYFAVKKAAVSTLNATVTDGKAVVFWHTQGSGKFLSMIFYVHAL